MKYCQPEDFKVRFSETDAAGVVHFTQFLRWAENAEGDFFRKHGLEILEKTPAGTKLGWPRVAVSIDYRAPAHYDDRIRVKIRPDAFPQENSRILEWRFEIFRVEKDASETLLAAGTWKNVYAEIDERGNVKAARAFPETVLNALKTFF